MEVTQKNRERGHLNAFLRRIGEKPRQWNIHAEQERPDFILISPAGDKIGLEMTELVTAEFGKLRTAERLVTTVVKEVVEEFIKSIGIPGALVMANNRSIVSPGQLRLEELRTNFQTHLQKYGPDLAEPNGSMKQSFKHAWGTVASIHRREESRVALMIDQHDHTPSYKETARSLSEIDDVVLERIEDKVARAKGYSTDNPLWLAIRNPNHQQIGTLSMACVEKARQLNAGRFARIILFNDPEHVLDACPPPPHCVEIC